MWFVLAGLLLARKAFSTAAQVAYTVHMVFNIKTVCLHYVILEMHSFPMSAAKHFYDNPLSIYLDPKIVLIYRPHPVHVIKSDYPKKDPNLHQKSLDTVRNNALNFL
jgi:hypothetical protein